MLGTETIISRRRYLGVTAALTLPAALAACQGITLTPASIVAQAGALAKGLAGMLSQIATAAPSLIPPATLATLQNDLALAQGAASALDSNLPAAAGASLAQKIDGYINAVLATLAAPPINGLIPAPFNMAVSAAALIIPQVETFVNTYLPSSMTAVGASPAAAAARQRFAGAVPGLTTSGALAILQRYART